MNKLIVFLVLILYSCSFSLPEGVYIGRIEKMYKSSLFNTSWFIELRTFEQKIEKLRADGGTKPELIHKLIAVTLQGKIVEITYKERKLWNLQKNIKRVSVYE